MATSSPMGGFRPVPGGTTNDQQRGGDLSQLGPQTGPDENEVRQGIIRQVMAIQQQGMTLAETDPTFGKVWQQIDRMLNGYLTSLSKKIGTSKEGDQPRY